MNINLNKKLVTKKLLLNYINDIDVYRHYIGENITLNGVIRSPLRKDSTPSFGFFYKNDEVLFNDFVLGGGDFVKFVQLKYNLNFFEALSKIAIDFKIDNKFHIKSNVQKNLVDNSNNYPSRENIIENTNKFSLDIKSRKWAKYDISFWKNFGINYKILQKYNVVPISHIFFYNRIIKADTYAYAFIEHKDNEITYKVYQPYNKDYKWLTDHNESVWQGWTQLPKSHRLLIITKSLKDVMSIVNVSRIPSVSLQAESIVPKEHIINELKSRFKSIYLLYDNDYDKEENWGQKFSNKIASSFDLKELKIPTKYKSKDFSDLVVNKGKKQANKILTSLIKEL